MEIKSIKQLEDALQYYVIDTEVCLEMNYSFKQVVITLYNDIQSIIMGLFTPQDLLEDILLINQIYKQL